MLVIGPRTIFEKPTIDSMVLAITEQLGAAADEELLAQLLDELDDMPYDLPLQAN